ncbi:unnamed protein product, partial [Hapterophycus canaliculatus]
QHRSHPQQQHQNKDGQLLQNAATTPERSSLFQGTPTSTCASGSFEAGRKAKLQTEQAAAVATQASEARVGQAGGGQAAGTGQRLTPKRGSSARGDHAQDSRAGSGGDDPHRSWPSNTRLFGDSGTSTDNTHILRLEQRMFLKAAFQLLEERDRLLPASIGAWNNAAGGWLGPAGGSGGGGGGGGGSNLRDQQGGFIRNGAIHTGKVGEGARFQFKHEHSFPGNRPRIIKSGILRKATARSVGRLEKTTWKNKYVELTPGSFSYFDSGANVLGKR